VTFDLVVATVGRVGELDALLSSLGRQTHRDLRVLVVDQNADDRIEPVLARHPSLRLERLRSAAGLSRARNAALPRLEADVVAFPDDDCVYPDDLLERVAARLRTDLDGVTGREPGWTTPAATLTRENLWNRAISFTIFLRRALVERVGAFDESLGLPSSSGEEIDYLIRALDASARIEYDPSLVVLHGTKAHDLGAIGARDGASIGYILRKHRYPVRVVARMLVRPAVGVVVDPHRARFHLATLRGRLRGYRR
jgi:glycosyltransferase involved in cell wall biosynthesis